jgi:hypothetical protein
VPSSGPFSTSNYATAVAGVTSEMFTIGAWIYPLSLTADQYIGVLMKTGDLSDYHTLALAADDNVRATSSDGVGTTFATGPAVAVVNQWQYVAGVWETSALRRCWRNTAFGSDNTTSKTPSGLDKISIGLWDTLIPLYPYDGYLAWLTFWNDILPATDLLALSKGRHPWLVRPDALVHCWPFWGQHSPEIDLTGASSATITGTIPQVDRAPPTEAFDLTQWRTVPTWPARGDSGLTITRYPRRLRFTFQTDTNGEVHLPLGEVVAGKFTNYEAFVGGTDSWSLQLLAEGGQDVLEGMLVSKTAGSVISGQLTRPMGADPPGERGHIPLMLVCPPRTLFSLTGHNNARGYVEFFG